MLADVAEYREHVRGLHEVGTLHIRMCLRHARERERAAGAHAQLDVLVVTRRFHELADVAVHGIGDVHATGLVDHPQ